MDERSSPEGCESVAARVSISKSYFNLTKSQERDFLPLTVVNGGAELIPIEIGSCAIVSDPSAIAGNGNCDGGDCNQKNRTDHQGCDQVVPSFRFRIADNDYLSRARVHYDRRRRRMDDDMMRGMVDV